MTIYDSGWEMKPKDMWYRIEATFENLHRYTENGGTKGIGYPALTGKNYHLSLIHI